MYISDYFALMGEQSGPGEACRQLPDAARQKVQGRGLTLAGLGVQASKERKINYLNIGDRGLHK